MTTIHTIRAADHLLMDSICRNYLILIANVYRDEVCYHLVRMREGEHAREVHATKYAELQTELGRIDAEFIYSVSRRFVKDRKDEVFVDAAKELLRYARVVGEEVYNANDYDCCEITTRIRNLLDYFSRNDV